MMIYELTDLTKTYGHRTVLEIPHLAIEKNRIYALLGPNGAGKTTLLNILGFLEAPTTGAIQYRSGPVYFTEKALYTLRRQVVVVHQHPILFTTSVFKNLEFGLKIRNISTKNRTRIIEAHGYRVIRFWNNEVLENIDGVLTVIAQEIAIARNH